MLKKTKVPHDDQALVGRELVGFPQFDVALHWHFRRQPVVRTPVEIVLPRPFVLERHELVHIDRFTVEQALVVHVDSSGEVVGF